ncbi:MAG: di-trans,poly-cis-decaprenylcistransferase [Ignavibacteria bacterium GWA2_54_16]|nr:MAG: di-trans,poly-cis-decaprenylcistransferase [Ignavibacteria bacterium GWA2_54_16]
MALEKASGHDKKLQERLLESGEIPRHIAVIMDGNGRWAQRRGLPRISGHHEGVNSVRDIVEACGQLGVKYLTLYAFSTENWKRPKEEVSLLMRLLLKALRDEKDRLHQNEVQLQAIGDLAELPQDVQDELIDGIKTMKDNTGLTLILALSYSGRWDITNAISRMYDEIRVGTIKKEQITQELVAGYLSTKDFPDPDLLIRTSGELRISNFLIWQLAYSELFISQEFWPAFRRKQLYDAISDFQRRERRFGMVSEQVRKEERTGVDLLRGMERFLKSASKS